MSFLCRPKTGQKVIGLYVVFYVVRKLGKSHRFVCRFLCRPKTGQKVIGLYVVFMSSENWSKSHRFVCRFFAVRKLVKKS